VVDNRSAGFFGIGGGFNFKSGDISGTAAKSQDDRQSPGMEYFQQENYEEGFEFGNSQFVDRSAQLNATLNSLAMMNVANIIKKNKLDKSKLEENEELKNKKEHDFLVDKIPGWEDYKDENDDFLYVD
jgi:hypothetical protein